MRGRAIEPEFVWKRIEPLHPSPLFSRAGSSSFLESRNDLGSVKRAGPPVRHAAPQSLPAATRRHSLHVKASQAGGSRSQTQANGNKIGVTVRNTSNRRPVARPKEETFKISGRTVVITGASQGCGRATALLFAKKGFNVVIAARDETKCMYTAEDCAKIAGRQGAALAIPTDVTSEMDVKRLANEVLSRYGTVDVVVSNAGYCMTGPFADTKLDDFKNLMDINFYGAVNMAREFMPVLKMSSKVKRLNKPSFVVVNSIGGVLPVKNMAAYCASKHALAGFSECLRLEAEAMGVHVGQVHPGIVNSDFMSSAEFKGTAATEARKQMNQMLRTPVAQSPEDIANAVWDCAIGHRNEVVVGPMFSVGTLAHRMTGINPTGFIPTPGATSTFPMDV